MLRALDLLFYKFLRLWGMLRDQIAWATTSYEDRLEITLSIYSKYDSFLPGGELFEGGLFDWEAALFAAGNLPQSGCVLIGAAGGGREMNALHQRGFSIFAFEPSERLAEGAERLSEKLPGADFMKASYEDFTEDPERFIEWIGGKKIDLVWIGYGSYTHVTDPKLRSGILRSARKAAPEAVVLLSAFAHEHADVGQVDRLRRWISSLCKRLGAKCPAGQGDGFSFHGGFYHQFSRKEVEELAAETGYELTLHRTIPQGQFCAVLKPR